MKWKESEIVKQKKPRVFTEEREHAVGDNIREDFAEHILLCVCDA